MSTTDEPRQSESAGRRWPAVHPTLLASGILLAALAVKLAFACYLDGRVYLDVDRALNFARSIDAGALAVDSDVINSKTFLGPLLWYRLHRRLGVQGLIGFNFCAFVALFALQYRLARRRYSTPVTLSALVLFAFYVGTNRNVVAGEPDDNLAAVLLALGVLRYLDGRHALAAGLCMGIAFLFKFWVAIFFLGLIAHLVLQRRGRDLLLALAGMAVPFLLLNCFDGLSSFRALFLSVGIQHAYSSWDGILFKFLSTGMAPMVLLSIWAWRHRRSESNTLFLFVSAAYAVYTIANRDAFAASFVMMPCMVFGSFLVAECLVSGGYVLGRTLRAAELITVLVLYVVLTSMITGHNLYGDTQPLALRPLP